ncbi:MAG: TIR domain-containing protein [Syntrophomonadaceae bacterium]
MAHDVFISYSSQDKQIADALCAKLESNLIRCWIAPRDVLPGMEYAKALINAISESRILILVLSASSNNSPQVLREVERAVSKGILILPFRIENIALSESMEYYVSTQHWLDALTPPLEKHLQELTDSVLLLLSDKRGTASFDNEQAQVGPNTLSQKEKNNIYSYAKQLFKMPAVMVAVIAVLITGSLIYYSIHKSSSTATNSLAKSGTTYNYQAVQESNQLVVQAQQLMDNLEMQSDVSPSTRDADKILELCDQAIQLNPQDDNPYEIRARVYEKMQLFDKALPELKTALDLNPNVPTNHTHMGMLYWQLGDNEAAIKEFKKALEIAAQNRGNNNPGWQQAVQKSKDMLQKLGVQEY